MIGVNDGSDDQSAAILGEYAVKDDRLKLLELPKRKNFSTGASRNRGLDAASGSYVIFLDDDVLCAPDLLKKMYSRATAVEADVVICSGSAAGFASGRSLSLGRHFRPGQLPKRKVFSVNDFPRHILTLTDPVPWNKLYRRRFLRQEGLRFQELDNCSDLFTVLLSLCVARRISYVDRPLFVHCKKVGAHFRSPRTSEPLCFIEALTALHDELQRRGLYARVERSFVGMAAMMAARSLVVTPGRRGKTAILRGLEGEEFSRMSVLGRPKAYYTELSQYCSARFVQSALWVYERLRGKGSHGGSLSS